MKHNSFIWITIFACLVTVCGCGTSRNITSGAPGATLAGAAIGGNIGGAMGGLIGETDMAGMEATVDQPSDLS